jgi:tetratricopeptide (TPR) repeat protein
LGETPESLRDLSVSLDNVAGTHQAQGDWSGAQSLYQESLQIRRQLVERLGETPESLRDLSVSLEKVAGTQQAQGDWSGAQSLYQEGLQISEALASALPNIPSYADLPSHFSTKLEQLAQKID